MSLRLMVPQQLLGSALLLQKPTGPTISKPASLPPREDRGLLIQVMAL